MTLCSPRGDLATDTFSSSKASIEHDPLETDTTGNCLINSHPIMITM